MFHQGASQPQPGSGVFPGVWLEEARFMLAAVRKVTAGRALQEGTFSYGEPWAMPVCARCWRAA